MAIVRQTAKLIRLADLNTGNWVKQEGMEPSYVETGTGEQVARARVLGTVVNTFTSEDGNFGSATIDDSTDTIRLKVFKTLKPLDKLNVGELVDVIGKVREYNGEIYIIPEVVRKVEDPNVELLRRLQLLKKYGAGGKSAGEVKPAGKPADEAAGESADVNILRKKVLDVIEAGKEGVDFSTIMKRVKAPEEEIEAVLNDLLSEGICYEPTPGKIRKI